MPLLETKGAGSAQGFGLSLGSAEAVYIEDVFSTYLYTGNSSTQTITNGIDLAGEGGLVWIKLRSTSTGFSFSHALFDTERGALQYLRTDGTSASSNYNDSLTAFNSDGFSLGTDPSTGLVNYGTGTNTYVSWTFRKQPKFFDIVTYTGTGTDPLTLNHNLQSVPGVIIIKCTSAVSNWRVHSAAINASLVLNLTNAGFSPDGLIKNLTSTTFQVNNSADVNSSGATYVAYLFAHNAGGFGLTGLDNVISCGSYTTDGSGNATVNLGYEPQWLLIKRTDNASNWTLVDTMRGWAAQPGNYNYLLANTSGAEANLANAQPCPNATGFSLVGSTTSATFIYIAIRRGPMKVPTSGTQVYTPIARTGTNTNATISGVGFSPDLVLGMTRSTSNQSGFVDRLRGINPTAFLRATQTSSETSLTTADNLGVTSLTMDGVTLDGDQNFGYINFSSRTYSTHFFRRAPGFFDEVCYTGDGASSQLVTHNLGVPPELYICKRRNGVSSWDVWSKTPGVNSVYTIALQSDGSGIVNALYNGYATSTTIEVGGQIGANASAATYVAYLFATVAGVSKVGRYTGTGTTQVINCGFTAGSRFVMIKRIDSTGDWYVWDSARGIVAGNDPYLLLNSTAAEVTNTDYVDTAATGFEISSTAPAAINANGGSFIFLAIA